LTRRSTSLTVDLGLLAGLAGLVLLAIVGSAYLRPYDAPELDGSPLLLPIYLLRSVARLATAYLLAVVLALTIGHLAARSRFARRLILPALDVLQSVPILGFFPVAVGFFIAVFRGSALGVEVAAVFLIFTSMFWNLAFGVYESLITLPEELGLAASQFGLRGGLRWSRLILPAVLPGLLYNSLLSWANGWYFLIASEIIAVGPARYTLPGLGSYLAQAVAVGRHDQMGFALAVLVLTTVAMHLLLWGPLQTWAERFHLDEIGDRPKTPRIVGLLARSRVVRTVARRLVIPVAQQSLTAAGRLMDLVGRHSGWTAAVVGAGVIGLLGYGAWALVGLFRSRPPGPEVQRLPVDLFLSFLRVAAGVALSVLIAVPLARRIARYPRLRTAALSVIQILASVPAAAFFPVIVLLLNWGLGLNAGALLLSLTTMFWYVLFNVLGAAAAIPKELGEAASAFGLKGRRHLRRVFLPAIAPGLVTGCVTAWGAGWNAMILCEYHESGGRVLSVRGIGATLARATYETGDLQVIAASLVSMVLLIVLVNRLFWDPLYQHVASRYKMEA
jgi:NitT/TauT family transport system permease protein